MHRDMSLALVLAERVAALHGGSLVLINIEDNNVVAGMSLPVEANQSRDLSAFCAAAIDLRRHG